ncbi:head-tail connector protein, partial [Sphingomonas sp.]|uniref:head-tail connector protein n=1 Tax=Sphingomonas sp. TaxID=28214 RepID=UPI002ED864DE
MTLEEAKAYLRLEGSGEDALLARLIATATALCEAFTGTVLVQREAAETLRAARDWQPLAHAPVVAITGVEALADDGTAAPLAADAYAIDIDAAGTGWVRLTRPGAAERLRVTCRAGLADDAAGVPAPLAQGVILLAAHLFDRRELPGAPPAAITALWRPWRRIRLRDA